MKGRIALPEYTLIAVLAATIVAAAAPPAGGQWRFVPEVRVTGGDESDLVVDPGLTRTIVPGGVFAEVTPTIAARRWVGRQALIDLGTFATLQQFINSESRLLYAQTVWGDLYQSFGRSWRGRLSASFDFFDDSERDAVRRFGFGGELGIMFLRHRWNAELWGGGRGRRYPNIQIEDGQSQTSTYTESAWTGGATLRVTPVERFDARVDGVLQGTDSNDSDFNSMALTGAASTDVRLVSTWYLTVSGTFQERDFTDRPAGEDTDRYWQLGAGLRYMFAPGWTGMIRYGYSDYTWPDGYSHDSHRIAIGVNYVWGRRNAPPPIVGADELMKGGGGAIRKPDVEGNVHLQVESRGAGAVSVAGDFNNWNPDANPLTRRADGWWEVELRLEPGTYEYVYVIDGKWTTPPEAQVTVDDGFGGSNGILEVLPTDL